MSSTPAQVKLEFVKKALAGDQVSDLARQANVSRKTIYEWVDRYAQKGIEGLEDSRVEPENHYKGLSPETKQRVLDYVAAHPTLSVHKLNQELDFIGHHGIQSLLETYNLTNVTDRLIYSSKFGRTVEPDLPVVPESGFVSSGYKMTPQEMPAPPPVSFVPLTPPSQAEPVVNLRALSLLFVFISTFVAGFLVFQVSTGLIFSESFSVVLGRLFAGLALTCGMLFFVYSLKYYISVALILFFSRQTQSGKEVVASAKEAINGPSVSSQAEMMPNAGMSSLTAKGLLSDVSNVELDRRPFVSIHVPLFNEKRVVNRLLEAVTTMGYDNYEVIVCDDSTDETKTILLDWKNHPRVKISHRESRSGYKGGALNEAIKLMDPRTEFVLVFDADFLPFSDTIEQFLKYFKVTTGTLDQSKYVSSPTAAIQGYQWHVLNKSENWITRGVRSEYAGSYVIERSGNELYGGLKQIAGSVFMIRADLLRHYGWGTSITEDFQLTLKLYSEGYKVVYTPYIQTPSECVSTLKRLVRQRMRWAEGHSQNIKLMFSTMMKSSNISLAERFEFLYLGPYYLQSAFFLAGTLFWFISEVIFNTRLPYWTAIWGWSLVLTNLFSLPLMNLVGMFLEEAEEKDYAGVLSFVLLSYILTPFQAYASVKGFIQKEEGPWFRTPKTGRITDTYKRGRFYNWLSGVFGRPTVNTQAPLKSYEPAYQLESPANHKAWKKQKRRIGNIVVAFGLILAILINTGAQFIEIAEAASPITVGTVSQTQKTPEVKHETNQAQRDPANPAQIAFPKEPEAEEKMQQAQLYQFDTPVGAVQEIFYKDPRFRIKNGDREVQFGLSNGNGLGQKQQTEPTIEGNRVTYKDIFEGVDVRLTASQGIVSESIVLNKKVSFDAVDFTVRPQGVTPREVNGTIEFTDDTTSEVAFTLSPPYMYEAGHTEKELSLVDLTNTHVPFSLGIAYKMHQTPIGWVLKKTLTDDGKAWLAAPNRQFPVVIDPSVVVSGGIGDEDTNYGSNQRKVAYVNGNWYAFHNEGTDVQYRKSADGSTWGSDVDLDTGDADNYNPTIWVKDDVIWVAWVDDSSNTVEFRSIDTANSDTLGTLTTCHSLGVGVDSSYIASIVVQTTGTDVVLSMTDTEAGLQSDIWRVTSIGTCAAGQSISNASGLADLSRPVLVTVGEDTIMVLQDGDLSYSLWSGTSSSWANTNSLISADTDLTFSVVSDGTRAWVLVQSGTTATTFYLIGAQGQTTLDSSLGGNMAYVDIFCPSSGDCKIVYTDPASNSAFFVDCDNTACSSSTFTALDTTTTIGSHTRGAPVAIDCQAGATQCSVIFAQRNTTNPNRLTFVDCGGAAGSATCTGNTTTQINNLGDNMPTYLDLFCSAENDCKWVYINTLSSADDIIFIDCNADADCSARTTATLDADVGDFGGYASLYCPASDDCKISYYDSNGSGSIIFADCGSSDANTSDCRTVATTFTTIDSDVGIIDTAYNKVDCAAGATECRVVYYDGTDQDVTFYDCNNSATCSSGSATDIDTAVGDQGSPLALECNNNGGSPDDCKIVYYDGADQDVTFVDCNNDTCSSPAVSDVDTSAGADSAFVGLDCTIGVTDCQIIYMDGVDQDVTLVDCNDADCDSPDATTDIDTDVAAAVPYMTMECPAGDNCKIVYQDFAEQDLVFADCNDAACSAPTLSDLDTSVGRQGIDTSMDCPTADDCKIVYWDFMSSSLKFIDCEDDDCSSPSSINSLDTTAYRFGPSAIDCVAGASACNVVYFDEVDRDITFIDCEDGDCGSPLATTDIDTSALGSAVDMDCITADNCKIVYSDSGSLIFLDCDATAPADCDSTPSTATLPDPAEVNHYDGGVAIDCVGGDTDCKVFFVTVNQTDATFYDCSAANCSTRDANTDLDTDIGTVRINRMADMDCPAADNCKLLYSDGTSQVVRFVDCGASTCATASFNQYTLTTVGTKMGGSGKIDCPSASDCKILFTNTSEQRLDFIDCVNESCVVEALTAPWTSETNILGVSLSYDTVNSDLYAHIIKDASEQVYWKSTDASSISWSSETSYGFTAGDINNLSATYSGAGTGEIGVVVRQGANFEFSAVPETWWWLTVSTLVSLFVLKRTKRQKYQLKL